MDHLINHMFLTANRAQLNVGSLSLGLVTSSDPQNYTIKVALQPDGVETGFIPYATPWYGWVAPPSPGQQAVVLFQEGDKNVPIGAFLLYWINSPPPGVASSGDTVAGEMLMHHSSGAYIKLDNSGKVIINGQSEIDVTAPTANITTTGNLNATASGTINLTASTINLNGNVVVDGNLTANNGSITMIGGEFTTNANIITSQDVTASGVSLKSHIHSGVTTGGDNTGAPV